MTAEKFLQGHLIPLSFQHKMPFSSRSHRLKNSLHRQTHKYPGLYLRRKRNDSGKIFTGAHLLGREAGS